VAIISACVRLVIGILLGLAALPWCVDLLFDTLRTHRHLPQDPWAVAIGAVLGLLVVFAGRPNWLVHTLIHELCHAVLCLILGVRVRSFQISDGEGGFVKHDQSDVLRGTVILIAPYTLPLLLAPVLLARMWYHEPSPVRIGLSGAVAFLFVTHLVGLWRNVVTNFWGAEGDLAKVGRFLALVIILAVLILVVVWTVGTLWSR
jgi:hypothetical protein